jgi:hypothetical protein
MVVDAGRQHDRTVNAALKKLIANQDINMDPAG